jgi:ribosome-associated protein
VAIPVAELDFRFSRSGGPGGQHVNRSATRVELRFDVARSPSLNEAQRLRIMEKLAGRIDGEGVLRLVGQSERSQSHNRREATERFQDLLRNALHVPKRRRRSKVPRWARERRLAQKRKRSDIKRTRRLPRADMD